MGKPEKNFFDLAVKDLGINNDNILMIGDDISSDIEGSINANLKAVQVKTGKFQKKDLEFLSTGFDTEFSGGSF